MASSNQLFLVFVLLLSISSISQCADLITKECGQAFSNNTVLQGNINTIILDLVTNTTANGFANFAYGSGNDTVYGIAECRGDVNSKDCSSCIMDAGKEIRSTCTNTTEARIWYHQCFLRYSTSNFTGQPDTNRIGVWTSSTSSSNMSVDPRAFKQTVKELLFVLAAAAANGENRKFGWGKIENPDLRKKEAITIYEMAQCTWDLQESACLSCLDTATRSLQSDCGELNGCFIILKSCSFRYEISPFLFLNGAAVTTRNIAFGNI